MSLQSIIIVYMIMMNGFCLFLFALDKRKAKHRRYRVSEQMLWSVSLIGGAIGGWIGMVAFRHKTKKISFKIGIPLIGIIHVFSIIYLSVHLS